MHDSMHQKLLHPLFQKVAQKLLRAQKVRTNDNKSGTLTKHLNESEMSKHLIMTGQLHVQDHDERAS